MICFAIKIELLKTSYIATLKSMFIVFDKIHKDICFSIHEMINCLNSLSFKIIELIDELLRISTQKTTNVIRIKSFFRSIAI